MSEEQHLEHIERQLDRVEEKVDHIENRQQAMEQEFARYRGAVGGALVVVTGIVAFVKLVWGWAKAHIIIQ